MDELLPGAGRAPSTPEPAWRWREPLPRAPPQRADSVERSTPRICVPRFRSPVSSEEETRASVSPL